MEAGAARQCLAGAADGTLPLAGLPSSLLKYQQLPELYSKIQGIKINLNEIAPLFQPEESQASIMGDVDSRITGVGALSLIKLVINMALQKLARPQVGCDSQINNIGHLSHSTHTNVSNQQTTSNRQQQHPTG